MFLKIKIIKKGNLTCFSCFDMSVRRQRPTRKTKDNATPAVPPVIPTQAPRVTGVRNYCWTLNNYTDEELWEISTLYEQSPGNQLRYLVHGREVGESGTPHLQGYLELTDKRMTREQHFVDFTDSTEIAYEEYITSFGYNCFIPLEWVLHGEKGPTFGKNAVIFEVGKLGGKQGERVDLQQFYEHVKAGKNDLELAEINFSAFSRTLKAIDRLRFYVRPVQEGPREIILLVGKPGVGKTRWAYAEYPDLYELPVSTGLWFDGYHGQDTVLLDEFEGAMPLNSALKVLDPYYVRSVAIKGGFTWWNPRRIIVTSNVHPSSWYDFYTRRDKEIALRRRFTKIYSEMKEVDSTIYWPISNDGSVTRFDGDNYFIHQS
ncbi:putative replication associated protein [Crucivirus sp.]|nr:putative replication associated protein [Crucivirus sp.]